MEISSRVAGVGTSGAVCIQTIFFSFAPYRVRSNSHYYLSFENKLLDLFPRRRRRPTPPPPLFPFLLSRLPIIISTRMTLSPCSPLLPFPRIPSHAPTPSFGLDTMMQAIIQPCRFLLYIPFDFFERKGLPTLSNPLYTFNEQPCYSLTGISSRPDFV